MGPRVDRAITRLVLRPFQTSQTYQNLKRHGEGVFHVTDDVELLARAAVGQLDPAAAAARCASRFAASSLADACRWFAFRVRELDDQPSARRFTAMWSSAARSATSSASTGPSTPSSKPRSSPRAIGILPAEQIRDEMKRLAIPVEKTAGEQERRAFAFLSEYINAN